MTCVQIFSNRVNGAKSRVPQTLPTLRIRFIWLFLALSSISIFGQDGAALLGVVVDPSGAVIPEAQVSVISQRTGAVHSTLTTTSGQFQLDSLPPGEYAVEVEKLGFNKLHIDKVVLSVRDRQSLRLSLEVASAATAVVNVTSEAQGVSTESSVATVLEHDYLTNLPLNDRSILSLVLMAPGVTSDAGNGAGDIHVNGLRANTNYYTLDGVSVGSGGNPGNSVFSGTGVGGGGFGGQFGGVIVSGSTSDSSNTSVPLDGLQDVRIQTSAFAPEFGRSPGAQVSLTSRAGTDKYHGSIYEYFRNGDLNAAQWFANASGLKTTAMHENRYGATFGGPVPVAGKTYFFLNYEGLHLLSPQVAIDSVPDLATREAVPLKTQPFVNAFPIPNGPGLGGGAAQFQGVFSNPIDTKSGSARLDHTFNSHQSLFARYSYNTLDGNTRSITSPSVVNYINAKAQSLTVGLLSTPKPTITNDLRVNFSLNTGSTYGVMDNFGGAVPLTDSLVFPNGITQQNGQFTFSILGASGYTYGNHSKNRQDQANLVDGVTLIAGNHAYKIGLDVREILPTYYKQLYDSSVTFNGIAATTTGGLLTGLATSAVIDSNLQEVFPQFLNFSSYFEDTWKTTSRLTITYGLRWDINPAPSTRSGPRPLAVSNNQYFPLTQSQSLYSTQWKNVAPRFGAAYQVSAKQGHETIVRFGYGWFYDVGYGLINGVFSSIPYSNSRILTLPVFPLSPANSAPPGLNPVQPYVRVSTAVNDLAAPKVQEASLAVEHHFGQSQAVTVTLVHNTGSNLLLSATSASYNAQYDLLTQIGNGGSSDYNGLQVQYRRRLSTRLNVQAAWTWGHALDTSSNDAGFGSGFASFAGSKGPSDYDVRHTITASGSYLIPNANGFLKPLTHNWFIEWNGSFRTGLPFDVVGVSSTTSNSGSANIGVFGQSRPNLVPGQPIWISDPHAPGGMRLNSAAFSAPAGFGEGNLGRNALRGFDASQVDISLRRQIAITERVRLNLSAEAYNIFNHPSFANPTRFEGGNLASPNFGIATQTLNQSISGGGTSINATGGSRTLEMVVRLQF